jgi:hypothetical protein
VIYDLWHCLELIDEVEWMSIKSRIDKYDERAVREREARVESDWME